MMDQTNCLQPTRIFDGKVLRQGCIMVTDGRVTGILDTVPAGLVPHILHGTLTPGYLDLQVKAGVMCF